ncbi:endonuclease/exonuclease/phosphatase family protein [Streptomyces johnsoniae]|uniref:Endonuclease/exonuclease/phosphatase family protein n=1 Tax=Streptomyces johnsoniae TaxID=3075532 RepID=A0ABU2S195_9ACTN|nr:endonuclease/exonuclease/phosphatase family protein [Streptomyces sp. DSM 41886]MDT0441860.1 endonuclease/exonuclease/phosphatase family protein [Streptomyces sp. DSM 41886]
MTPAPRTLPLLTAVITVAALELLRLAGASGSAWAVLPVTAAAASAGPLVWWLGPRRALPAAVAALAAARLLVQIPAARAEPVVAVAAGLALAALLLTVRRLAAGSVNGPGRAARAIALAVGADVALRLPLDLLDPVWRGGAAGWLWALLLSCLLVAGAWRLWGNAAGSAPGGGAELALLGPALALYAVLLASPAFVAAQGGLSVPAAGWTIACGTVLGVWALSLPQVSPRAGGIAGIAAPGVLAVAVAVFVALPAPLAAPAALAGTAALPAVLRRLFALPRLLTGRGALADLALAGCGAAVGYGLLVLPVQLGLVPGLFAVAAAAGLGWSATRTGAAGAVRRLGHAFRPVLVAVLLLAAPPLLTALRDGPRPLPTDTAGGQYRLLTWNVHWAVNADGELVPDAVADVIADSGAHVAVLQEVPRGRPAAGGLDLVTFLERRFDATAVWVPGADRQFGNLVLTSLPVTDSVTESLPRAGGDMDRSYAAVTVRLTDGEEAAVVGTHLDGGEEPGPRLRQLEPLLAAVGDDPGAVLAGDLNARPGSREMAAVAAAGLRSAQDEIGDPERDTATTPPRRVDWILGGSGVAFGDFDVIDSDASDHLPLAVTVYLD